MLAHVLTVAAGFRMLVSDCYSQIMQKPRKITVEVPADLLRKAQRATGKGITQTVCAGLQVVAASQAYAGLRQMRGKVRLSQVLSELKHDR